MFWYDYVKLKYGEKTILCCMDTGSFVVYIKRKYICSNIAKDVETRFDASSFDLDRPLPKVKNQIVIALMKDELGGKIMTEFAALRTTSYIYLRDGNDENKKAKYKKGL